MKYHIKLFVCAVLACMISLACEQGAQAQSGYASSYLRGLRNRNSTSRYSVRSVQNRVSRGSVSAVGVGGVNRRSYSNLFSSSSSQRSKPFSALQRGPAVSPYLQLNGSLDGVSDYYNVVRPQREQARANLRQQRQINARRRQADQYSAVVPYDLQGDENTAPTGHSTTFMFLNNFQQTGNFYPPVQGLNKQGPQ